MEYFIYAASFAAPFVSDPSTHFVEAESPEDALEKLANEIYQHPCGLYAASCFASADAYHKGEPALARWLSNHAAATEGATSIRSIARDHLEVDGVEIKTQPGGKVVDATKETTK